MTIMLFMNFWSQGLVDQTFAAPPDISMNDTLSPVSMVDSDCVYPTHLLACFLFLSKGSKGPYLVCCVKGSLSETCPTVLHVSEVLEHAVHMIPCAECIRSYVCACAFDRECNFATEI